MLCGVVYVDRDDGRSHWSGSCRQTLGSGKFENLKSNEDGAGLGVAENINPLNHFADGLKYVIT